MLNNKDFPSLTQKFQVNHELELTDDNMYQSSLANDKPEDQSGMSERSGDHSLILLVIHKASWPGRMQAKHKQSDLTSKWLEWSVIIIS